MAVVKGHTAPFDFIADYLFGIINFAVVLANRSGGKTINFGILDTIMAYLNDDTEIAAVAAIKFQADKGYQYFKDFSARFPFHQNIISTSMGKTNCVNRSTVSVLTGTMSGVNSPHPQILFVDEIDLMTWPIIQQALSMPQSKKGIRSRTVLTSTRKFANGPMQRFLNEADQKGSKVYSWNVWDIMEPLPKDNPELMQEIFDVFGAELPDNLDQCNGYYSWEDVLLKKRTLDDETWQVEWVCSRPGLQGVIYGDSFNDDDNVIAEWEPQGKGGHIYLFEDFGYGEGHPDVVLFTWIPDSFDRMIIFDELYMTKMGTAEIWEAIGEKLAEYGFQLPNKNTKEKTQIEAWIPDPHGLTEIEDRAFLGAPMFEKVEDSQMYLINNGIKLVARLLKSGRLMVHARCIQLVLELRSYKRKKNADGTYSVIAEKKEDHGPDALRYGVIALYPLLASKIFGKLSLKVDKNSKKPEKKVETLVKAKDAPLTAGLLEEKF